ncbi:AhpC/TSA family protein [Rhizobiaceae bacterium n13]|uniref:AhpC/TSA family protein n=1 Tax=Ferirhizobium litorale TaxID=2927786 RepID=A0AAE3U086_9HYPH|nr:peroxiredoxin-like family protein [Fererhizobium litorale]MDI7861854.1 AhpC/TSA family protein [Fererhizobium litorale]MDI7921804.1 AhpC/TSA family protein [Fererhizobium litorale]
MDHYPETPLKPGDRAPDVVLDAITRNGKIAIRDFRGQKPVLVGLFRGLQCPFCRRQIAAMSQLEGPLHEKGVESLTVVNTPIERARLYFRYHPLPNLLAASDPDRISHRAFGLPNIEFTESETVWPYKIGADKFMEMKIDLPELPQPMGIESASDYLNKADDYEITEEDEWVIQTANSQLVGEFLVDRDGVIRWCFTEVEGGGSKLFTHPTTSELMSAASQL